MVNKIRHEKIKGLFKWCYIYKDKFDNYNFIVCDDLNKLKDKVIEMGFNWKIIDNLKYNRSIKENNFNLKNIEHRKWSYSGIYRVKKIKDKNISQGFLWVYRYKHKSKVIDLSSTDLNELKEKVLKNDLEWKILDETTANKSFMENQENFIKYGFSTNKNKTGILRVYKGSDKNSKQGFYWCYGFSKNNKRRCIQSVNLINLKQKVLMKGWEWKVIDEILKEESFKENERNMKKYYD